LLSFELLTQQLKRPFQYHERITSTQDIALKWLEQGAPQGAVVIADEQLSGRGRQGRTWYTPPHTALALSLILKPTIESVHQVTMLGALAIYDTITPLTPKQDAITIKWANDVKLQGGKISGILPESAWHGDKLQGVVLGMGLNIRVDFSRTDINQPVANLEQALGHPVNRVDILVKLLENLDHWTSLLGTKTLFETWAKRLETIGQNVKIGDIEGVAESVNPDGSLFVRDRDGIVHQVIAGDVLSLNTPS
jgi:BirA family biotin operon repressor/biotin-[acetyl-CoA-carboxylase] ligase